MKIFLLQLLFLVQATSSYTQAVSWELSAEPGNQAFNNATFQSANFSNCFLTRGAGNDATTGAGSMNSSAWFEDATPTTLAQAIDNGDYYEFTINSINCIFFNPNSIKIVLRSSATGPNTATLRCSSDGFTANLGTVTVTTTSTVFDFPEAISPNSNSVTYRLYGYGTAAGGGTPSAGGTMRIGSSAVATDNDIELFGSTTFAGVLFVPNITVNTGDFVPGTVFTPNVPGSTVNWTRTPESIGLGITSGTGNVPSFNAANNTGSPSTSTFSVTATLGSCTGPATTFTITVNPAACDILSVNFLGNPSACDDNGTPSDPSDDFFTQNLQAAFINRPTTGNLQVLPGGDEIGTYSIPVIQIVGNSHIFNGVKFKADGTPSVVQMNFTDDPGCIDAATGPTVQPCSTGTACDITSVSLLNIGTCNDNGTSDPGDDFFTASVSIFFVNPPPTGLLQIEPGGDAIGTYSIPAGNLQLSNNVVFNNVHFKADGTTTIVEVEFTIPANQCVQTVAGPAVPPCSFLPPVLTCPPAASVSCAGEVPAANPATVGETHTCPGNVTITHLSDLNSNVVCINKLTITRTYQGTDQCAHVVTCSQTITLNDQTPPTVTCPASITLSCANQVPAVDFNVINSLGVTDNCMGSIGISRAFLSETTSNQTCNDRFTLTRIFRGGDACTNTATCTQTITVNDQTAPAMTCPANVTVSCASQVPAASMNSVTGVSDNCGGGTAPTVAFVNDVISNQTCANRFTVTRTYRATDACGNSATCAQILTVNDQTPPVFTSVPANVTVDCYLVPPVGIATASDNCTGGATVAFLGEVKTPGICPVFYILTRTWRATDVCGNSATAVQVVTVTDTNAPQFIVAPANKIVECGPDNLSQLQDFIDTRSGAVVEDCAQITYSYGDSPIQYNGYDCGNTFRKNIRFFATDECGNVSYRDASFTVQDLTPPVFSTPPQNVEIECDVADGNAEIDFYDWLDHDAYLVAEDNCGSVELEKVLINASTGCGNTWQKTYEFRAKDECGNLSKTTATFASVDHTPPTLICLPNDNVFLPCQEDVPGADEAMPLATDCSGATVALTNTWTNGTGCPNWTMTVAYQYTATDACGNETVCERAYYVKETDAPTLVCPDTIKLTCVDDIPGPQQLFGYIKNQLAGNCAGGFTGIAVINDSGVPQNGATHRSYTITAKNHCGLVTSACTVTFLATGTCNSLCTASQASWGDPNGTVGNMNATDAITQLIQTYGPVKAGGGNHTVSAPDAACVQELLFGSGNTGFLPTGNYSCGLPASLSNPDGSLNNQLAANVLALQLNIWYNLKFNDRNLGVQSFNDLPPCLIEFPLLKDLGQNNTVQDLLNLANLYLQGIGYYGPDVPGLINSALDNLNYFRVDCQPNAPCERPAGPVKSRNQEPQQTALHMFPNPGTDAVTLEFWSDDAEEMVLKIVDTRGRVSARKVQAVKSLNSVGISLNGLSPGIYWVSLQSGERLQTMRLVKVEE